MAFSYVQSASENLGTKLCKVYELDFDSVTEGKISTGLSNVISAVMNNETTEAQGLVQRNYSAAATASPGDVFISGVTASDLGTLVVIGN